MSTTTVKKTAVIKVTGTTSSADVVYAGLVWIERIYWYNPATNGHLVSITDTAGNTIALFNCVTNNIGYAHERVIRAPFNGIKIDDMDSGTIFIHLGSGR